MIWRGHLDLQTETVRWRGLVGVYSIAEQALLAELDEDEQWLVHTLKALCGGEIIEPDDPCLDHAPYEGLEPVDPPEQPQALSWRMICIGDGPGPKNVLAERADGFRTVVPYPVWKFRLSRGLPLSERKGPSPQPRRRRKEPLAGQTAIAT